MNLSEVSGSNIEQCNVRLCGGQGRVFQNIHKKADDG